MPDIFDELQPDNVSVATDKGIKGDIFDQLQPDKPPKKKVNFQFIKDGEDIREKKVIPQLTKGLYEKLPFGKRVVSLLPNAEEIQANMESTPAPRGLLPNAGRMAGEIAPDVTMMTPVVGAAGAIPKVNAIARMATGVGVYAGAKAGLTEGAGRILPEAGKAAALTAGLGYAGKGAYKLVKSIPEAVKAISNIPNNLFRGGLSKPEAIRIESEYGSSNGRLAEVIKEKLNNMIGMAEKTYTKAVNSFKGNSINSQEFYQTIQKGLRDKGWVDLTGNPTTRYKGGLDPITDKLTDLYLDMRNATTAEGKRVTGKVISKVDFSTYRDTLGAMLRDKPSDVLIMKSRNALYNSAEKSGMTGIKAARDLEREAFEKSRQFLNRNTGDLKVATESKLSRVGMKNKLSEQELKHIRELSEYIDHPILQDAAKINKLNEAKNLLAKRKEQLKWLGIGAGSTLVGLKGKEALLK